MGQADGAVPGDAARQLPSELELSTAPARPEGLRLHRAEGNSAAQRGLHGVSGRPHEAERDQGHPGGDVSEPADHRRDRTTDRRQGPGPPELGQRGPGHQDGVRVLRPDLRRARPRPARGQDFVVRPLPLLLVGLIALVPAWAEANLSVVATTEHYAAIARVIGGDRISVAYLAKGAQDPHAILPKRSFSVPMDRAEPQDAKGKGLETAWLPTALTECTNNRIREGSRATSMLRPGRR